MEREQFLGRMALALQAPVQPLAKLSLPLGVILLGTAAQVIGQFQTLVRREAVHRALQLCNAHASIYTPGKGHFKTYLDVSPAKPAALINTGASARRWGRTESFQAFQRLRWAARLGSVDEIVMSRMSINLLHIRDRNRIIKPDFCI